MIKLGVWEIPEISKNYFYRVATTANANRQWRIYRQKKQLISNNIEATSVDGPKWVEIENGFYSKKSAVEFALELVAKETFNPVKDHLDNIDDGVDLDQEGY